MPDRAAGQDSGANAGDRPWRTETQGVGSEDLVCLDAFALEDLTGRKQGNLSRTLKTMSRYGLVRMVRVDRKMRPVADAERYQIVA